MTYLTNTIYLKNILEFLVLTFTSYLKLLGREKKQDSTLSDEKKKSFFKTLYPCFTLLNGICPSEFCFPCRSYEVLMIK